MEIAPEVRPSETRTTFSPVRKVSVGIVTLKSKVPDAFAEYPLTVAPTKVSSK